MSSEQALILVVDDNEMNRDMLARRLERQGYRSISAEDGVQALEILPQHAFDLVLLDIMMPRMNGYELLQHVKNDSATRHIPIIMISAVDDLDSVVKCVEMGADDYLFKPFNPILLKARVNASLEKKRLRDQEQVFLKQMEGKSEAVQLVPPFVAERLKNGQQAVADSFNAITVLAAGLVGLGEFGSPAEMVDLLNRVFAAFDRLVDQYGAYRVRATGNTYMLAGGVPLQSEEQAQAIGQIALDMQRIINEAGLATGMQVGLQIGIHTGAAVGGIVKVANYTYYDLWGEAVNLALQLQNAAARDSVAVSAASYDWLQAHYLFEGQREGVYILRGNG